MINWEELEETISDNYTHYDQIIDDFKHVVGSCSKCKHWRKYIHNTDKKGACPLVHKSTHANFFCASFKRKETND